MPTDLATDYEPLPGYRLIEHVGDGGYGEVWRAEAPGGLTKAIKFVFGQQTERRAMSELRALEKVRGLRHPFLLSLERIEVVEGRLLVVTELADESVRDRFDAYRKQGMPGIPRDELLSYLRDAADALDFINTRHGLQHLDVKPENLLLVAGHVKVADFGLVKSIQQSEASLVGGMTPLYSAPEVFRGAPSRRSDQYSLAILYQEMLTGTVPFAGSNAAELTLQHLNDEPELSPLCSADRYVVSRALAKDLEHRYPSCLEFVDALQKASEEGKAPSAGIPTASTAPSKESLSDTAPHSSSQTEFFGEEPAPWGAASEPLLIELPPAEPAADLPPLEIDNSDLRPTPVLLLGIGGTAGRVLSHVRRQLGERFGNPSSLPTIQTLLLDTDPKALAELARRNAVNFQAEELLTLPLHRPQHYRAQSEQFLRWLSRRWLYNIPRSMRTEGLRPLGRLALADHARQTCQRIRMAVAQAVDAESIEASNQATGQPFRDDAVRVYIVASVAGGTGSGMALDLGYVVQTILEKLGIAETRVIGLMAHSTGREPRHCELARVNTFSWLTEFHHLSQPGRAYPGDASCGLPAHGPDAQPFEHTYFVNLGENLETGDFDAATQSLADYLLLDILTPAQRFFDACRADSQQETSASSPGGLNLRSLGVYRKSATPAGLRDELAATVCQHVLAAWQRMDSNTKTPSLSDASNDGGPVAESDHGTEPVVQGALQLVRRLQLEPAGIAANVRALIETLFDCDAATFLSRWLAEPTNATAGGEQGLFRAVDRLFGAADPTDAADGNQVLMGQQLNAVVGPLEEKLRSDVRRWVVGHLDDPQERLAGARQAASWLDQHFRAVEGAITRLARDTADKLNELQKHAGCFHQTDAPAGNESGPPPVDEQLSLYFRLRLDLLSFVAATDITRRMLCDLKTMTDDLIAFGRELGQIASTLASKASAPGTDPHDSDREASRSPSAEAVRSRLPDLVAAVDQRLQQEFLQPQGGLLTTVLQGGRPRAQLSAMLQEFSQQAVQDAISQVDVLADALHGGQTEAADESPLRQGLESAMPQALQFGGCRWVLTVLPKEATTQVDTAQLSQALGADTSRTVGYDNSLMLCVEAERLSLVHVAVDIVNHRRDCTEFAHRVHTRTDIAWTPLVDQSTSSVDDAKPSAPPVAPLVNPEVQQTQMISFETN